MNVDFKIATLNDVEEIVDLCNECFNENTSYEFLQKQVLEKLYLMRIKYISMVIWMVYLLLM